MFVYLFTILRSVAFYELKSVFTFLEFFLNNTVRAATLEHCTQGHNLDMLMDISINNNETVPSIATTTTSSFLKCPLLCEYHHEAKIVGRLNVSAVYI